MPLSYRHKKLLIGTHPIGAAFIESRGAQRPVLVRRAPKRLALKKAAMAGRALRRVDLLAPGDQSKIIGVGEVDAPASLCELHVSRKDDGNGHPEQRDGHCPKDRASIHSAAYGPANTRMIAIMPLSS